MRTALEAHKRHQGEACKDADKPSAGYGDENPLDTINLHVAVPKVSLVANAL